MVERRQRCSHLRERDVRLHPADYTQKARAAHHSFIREPWKLERFRRPDFRDWVRSEPSRRHVWQHAYNRVRSAIECDAAADHVGITAEALLPEILGDDCDIGALFFLRQEVASENWAHGEQVKIVRSQTPAKDLHRIAKTGQCEEKEILRR